MAETIPSTRIKAAKIAGSLFFILLALASIFFAGFDKLSWKDLVLLAFACTPLLINKKIYYLLFGTLMGLLFLYALYIVFSNHALYMRGELEYDGKETGHVKAFGPAYLFCIVSIFFSVLLMYVGLRSTTKKAVT